MALPLEIRRRMWGNDSGDRRPPTSSDSGYDDRAQDPVSGYGRGAALRQGERKSRGEEDSAGWTADEDEKLSKSVRENGLDDWTLGDWSEVGVISLWSYKYTSLQI